MTILKLVLFDPFVRVVYYSTLWEQNLVALNLCWRVVCVLAVLQTPQLNNFVVCGQQLQRARLILMQKLKRIYFFFEFNRLKMVKFRLMRLYLWKVAIVEVARISQVHKAENNNAAASISNCQILAALVECDGREHIWLGDLGHVTFAEPINVHPVYKVSVLLLTCICLTFALRSPLFFGLTVLGRWWLLLWLLCWRVLRLVLHFDIHFDLLTGVILLPPVCCYFRLCFLFACLAWLDWFRSYLHCKS